MKQFKGTKGNWKVYNPNEIRLGIESIGIDLESGDKSIIAFTDKPIMELTYKESLANAKLIASAPELLEALIKCEKLLNEGFKNSPLHSKVINAISKAL